jgi:hypothetical protein
MMNINSGLQGAVGIMKMKGKIVTYAVPCPLPAEDNAPQLNSRGLTSEPVMSTGISVRMTTMRMQMMRKNHRQPMMDQRRMRRTECIVGVTSERVMSRGISIGMAMMQIRIRSNKHRKPMMDQRRMWRTVGIVLESVKIGLYISDLSSAILAKQMQQQAMYLKR